MKIIFFFFTTNLATSFQPTACLVCFERQTQFGNEPDPLKNYDPVKMLTCRRTQINGDFKHLPC
jgi:hypothetical protein